MASTIGDDITYYKAVNFAGTVSLPANAVGDAHVAAASPLGVTKTTHQYIATYGRPGNATSETDPIHVCKSAGTIAQVRAGSVTAAAGDSTVTVDIRKNGTTVLAGVITLDSANTAYVSEAGSLSAAGVAANDVLTAVIAAAAGTGTLPTGVFAQVVVQEAA
jgi:hypothetical protein